MKDPEYLGIVNIITQRMGKEHVENKAKLAEIEPQQILASLSRIEQLLTVGIKLFSRGYNFETDLRGYLLKGLRDDNIVERAFKELIEEKTIISKIANLIDNYGDSVWALAIISAVVPSIAEVLRPHVIVTNPPWVQMTEYQTSYAKKIREEANKVLRNALGINAKKAASIVAGSDVACMALYKALGVAKEGVGFVMNREQSFYSRSSVSSGVLLTYSILKRVCGDRCDAKVIDMDYDAFHTAFIPHLS